MSEEGTASISKSVPAGLPPTRVLLVDDSPQFVTLVTSFLTQFADLDVLGTATSAADAVEKAGQVNPDVIVVDLAMPGMNGLQLLGRLADLMPGVGRVVLTLYDTDGYRKAAYMAGADSFVAKSNITLDLPSAIRNAAQLRPLGRSRRPATNLAPHGPA
jgi:DNA-binding NarL/FixJ family response regulator